MRWEILVHERIAKNVACTNYPYPASSLKSQMAYSYDSLISLVVHLMNHVIFFCTAVHFTHIFFAEDFLQSYEPIFLDTFIPLVWYKLKNMFLSVSLQDGGD